MLSTTCKRILTLTQRDKHILRPHSRANICQETLADWMCCVRGVDQLSSAGATGSPSNTRPGRNEQQKYQHRDCFCISSGQALTVQAAKPRPGLTQTLLNQKAKQGAAGSPHSEDTSRSKRPKQQKHTGLWSSQRLVMCFFGISQVHYITCLQDV